MASKSLRQDRYLSLDTVRGFAVMGILAMNIVAFAMPVPAYMSPAAYGSAFAIDWVTWGVNFVLIDSKMRGLFSILFGASTILVIERAERGGNSPARNHYARMVWLLVFGLLHFYFIWFGDILALYAMCGMLLYFFRNLSAAGARNWAICLLTIQLLIMVLVFFQFQAMEAMLASGAASPEEIKAANEAMQQMRGDFGQDPARVQSELAIYGGGYAGILAERTGPLAWTPLIGFFASGLETLGLMLIGMALYRSGMLTGQWSLATYRRWFLICFLIGIPPLLALVYYQFTTGFDYLAIFGSSIAFSMPFDVIMAIGWAAIFVHLSKTWPDNAMIRRVAAAGRAAFTNYLGTSIAMTCIFYGYGLGLFGEVNRASLYLFVLGAWAIMLLWSKPWLMRFRYGPLEWLWRSLARGKLQPMAIGR
ncbi:MAG: DUF418 domain-containing protein [Blastomonas sp.]